MLQLKHPNIISNPIQKSRVDNNVNIQWLSALKWDYTFAASDDNFFRRFKLMPKTNGKAYDDLMHVRMMTNSLEFNSRVDGLNSVKMSISTTKTE